MKNKLTMFGIRVKNGDGGLLEYRASSGGDNCCVSIVHTLVMPSATPEQVWMTSKRSIAEYVIGNDTPKFNAEKDTPAHDSALSDHELEVVEIEILYD